MTALGPSFQPGDVVPGSKYRVVRQLGAGGMGIVYQVIKPPQINGVLKLMSADLAVHDEFRTRFFDEVRVLAQLDHPNIVRVFDYDALPSGTPYYVMELLNGRTVRDVLSTVGRVPPRVAFEVTRQLLEALHCAHTHEIPVVHRDIKPENIFLHAPRHGEPVVKLIDFGVVAIADRTHDGTFVGTWKYAAPEQIRGERATPATDLYAVGLVLYEMLAGCGPFDHYETGPAMATAHVLDVPKPVSTFAPWVPSSVVALISSALSKDPQKRPRDAYAFAEKLFELEWANDGKTSEGVTREGPLDAALSRVLTDVAAVRGAAGALPAPLDPATDERHRGSTLVGVGAGAARHEPTTPDDDALLAGLLARDGSTLPLSKKARESNPEGAASARAAAAGAPPPGTPPPGQVRLRPSPVAPAVAPAETPIRSKDAVTLEAPPSDPRIPVAVPREPVETPTAKRLVDTDTFASSETDARRGMKSGTRFSRVVLPALLLAALTSVAFVSVLVVRKRAQVQHAPEPPDPRTEVAAPPRAEPLPVASETPPATEPVTAASASTTPPAAARHGAAKGAARPTAPSAATPPARPTAPAASSGGRTDLLRQL